MSPWWGTRSNVSPRLRLEVEAMRATFGNTFKLRTVSAPAIPAFLEEMRATFGKTFNLTGSHDDLLYWEGTVELNLATLTARDHMLRIIFPVDYPNRPPEAYVMRPRVYSEKHQYEDGQLCLFNPKDGEQYGWNPSRSTAVTVGAWAVQWLYAYYTWRSTGVWPGIEERVDPNTPLPPRRRR